MRNTNRVVLIACMFGSILVAAVPALGQAPGPDPCTLLANPGLQGEYLSPAHESFLLRFCRGELISSDASASAVLFRGSDATAAVAGSCSVSASNVLVNSRLDTFPDITESETSIDTYDADADGNGIAEQVVMAWNGAVGTAGGLGYGYSTDIGVTWTDVGLLGTPAGYVNCCDPAVAVDSTGTFYIAVLTSDASGNNSLAVATLTPPGTASAPALIPGMINVDREDMAVDNTGTAATDGNIYVCYTEFGVSGPPVRLVRSTDGGATWSTPLDLGSSGSACRVEVGLGGEVFVAWQESSGSNANIHVRKCTPGATECAAAGDWTADLVVDTVVRAQDSTAAATCGRPALNGNVRKTFENPTLAVNPVSGRVHLVYSYKTSSASADDSDIRYQALNPNLSVAVGAQQLNVDGTTTDQWRPMIAVKGGTSPRLAVGWLSRQLDTANNMNFDVYMRMSTDDGVTFGTEQRVTTASSPIPTLVPNFEPDIVNCYMSDYETMDADAKSLFVGWSDNRLTNSGNPDPDIRFSLVSINESPDANAGADQVVECTSPTTTEVMLDGTASSDLDGDVLTYLWSATGIPLDDPTSATSTGQFPFGATEASLEVCDGLGSDDDVVAITVVDTTPPSITNGSVSRPVLWPPNHKMADESVDYDVEDVCDTSPTCALTVASDEPVNGTGDGDRAPDWIVVDSHSVQLRSERAGTGDGREYTVTITCVDDHGNASSLPLVVTVPHDQSGHANAMGGFNSLGTGFVAGARTYEIGILSRPGFNPTAIDLRRIWVGNLRGLLDPLDVRLVDVNCDGTKDVIGAFDVAASAVILGRSPADEPLAMRYETLGGEGFIVNNILALGTPVTATSCTGTLTTDR